MPATQITIDNFKDYIGKEVYVSWTMRFGGMVHPEHNILVGMNEGEYFLKAVEDEDWPEQYWRAPVSDDRTDQVLVFDWHEYKSNMSHA